MSDGGLWLVLAQLATLLLTVIGIVALLAAVVVRFARGRVPSS
jgi:hypothetical protein